MALPETRQVVTVVFRNAYVAKKSDSYAGLHLRYFKYAELIGIDLITEPAHAPEVVVLRRPEGLIIFGNEYANATKTQHSAFCCMVMSIMELFTDMLSLRNSL